jgi:hypothetical protein
MVLMLFVQIVIIILDRVCYLFRSVFCKLLLQYATISWWCAKIFFEWPVSSQTAFNANSYLQFFFVVKLFYFIVSGLQIFTGYPPLETAGFQFLTRYPGMYAVYAYKAYRAIPFVFELRTMLDWMCSVSSLDLWDTLKVGWRDTEQNNATKAFVSGSFRCGDVRCDLRDFSWKKFTERSTACNGTNTK